VPEGGIGWRWPGGASPAPAGASGYTPLVSRGAFIVLEGPDGAGKSTQAALLVENLRAEGRGVDHLRDPGGTAAGDRIREILLAERALDPAVEIFLFLASRAQLVAERIRPALAAGRVVVCERFTLSTVVYQGRAADPPPAPAALERLRETVRLSALGVEPDLVLVLDVDPGTGLGRKDAGARLDRIESRGEGFQGRVRRGYLEEAPLWRGAEVLPPATVEVTARRVREAAGRVLPGAP